MTPFDWNLAPFLTWPSYCNTTSERASKLSPLDGLAIVHHPPVGLRCVSGKKKRNGCLGWGTKAAAGQVFEAFWLTDFPKQVAWAARHFSAF